ncbi:MAG: 2-phospho-L-lactate transferase CofD family protein, partial [bacterium]|nr:2-phospho-L-lactate transferase CofD family protein [bacterium]
HDGRLKIQKIWLSPKAKANPKALLAIKEADLIILGPGDLFSSVIPNLLVESVPGAIKKSKAKVVFVCNIMTKFGETTAFTAEDFLNVLEKYLGKNIVDCLVVNKTKPLKARVKKYEKEKAEFVRYDKKKLQKRVKEVVEADLLRSQGFIRHDSDKLAKVLFSLV